MEAEAEADMARPIPMSRQGTVTSSKAAAMSKRPVIHTPNKQAIPMLHNPLRHNKHMEGDSNKEATKVDMVKLRQRMAVALLIQPVQARRAAVMVRSMPRTVLGRELMVTSWRKRRRDDTHERSSRRIRGST